MKNFLWSLFLFSLFLGLIYYLHPNIISETTELLKQPCSEPLTYKIGQVDKRYGISEDQFKKNIIDAGSIWTIATNKNLFQYDPEGKITISLIYDERQALESKVENIESKLEDKKQEIKPTKAKYESIIADYKKKLAALNSEINEWNSRGGAPNEIYQQLVQRQQELREQASQINEFAKELNQSVQDYNLQVTALQQTAEDLNQVIQNKPEEGIYDPNKKEISIFINVNNKELVHTLAHELGHSIGLNHSNDPSAIMYPFTTSRTVASTDDINSIGAICSNTLWDRVQEKLKYVRFRIPGFTYPTN